MNVKRTTAVGLAAADVFVFVGAARCDKYTEPYKDGPRSGVVNRDPADIIEMPDGFSNVASKCDGPDRLYVAYKGDANRASITVVPNDPRCTGK